MPLTDGELLIENAQIMFKNFTGKEGRYNQEGDRNFCIRLDGDRELAEELRRNGWNVKTLRAREEGDEPTPYIIVSVKYQGRNGYRPRPPTIVLVTSKGRTNLSEEECAIIDDIDIKNVDLIIRPHTWEVNGNTGVKAYLKSIYVTMHEDYLQRKYSEVPELGSTPTQLSIESGDDGIWEADVVSESDDGQLAIES